MVVFKSRTLLIVSSAKREDNKLMKGCMTCNLLRIILGQSDQDRRDGIGICHEREKRKIHREILRKKLKDRHDLEDINVLKQSYRKRKLS